MLTHPHLETFQAPRGLKPRFDESCSLEPWYEGGSYCGCAPVFSHILPAALPPNFTSPFEHAGKPGASPECRENLPAGKRDGAIAPRFIISDRDRARPPPSGTDWTVPIAPSLPRPRRSCRAAPRKLPASNSQHRCLPRASWAPGLPCALPAKDPAALAPAADRIGAPPPRPEPSVPPGGIAPRRPPCRGPGRPRAVLAPRTASGADRLGGSGRASADPSPLPDADSAEGGGRSVSVLLVSPPLADWRVDARGCSRVPSAGSTAAVEPGFSARCGSAVPPMFETEVRGQAAKARKPKGPRPAPAACARKPASPPASIMQVVAIRRGFHGCRPSHWSWRSAPPGQRGEREGWSVYNPASALIFFSASGNRRRPALGRTACPGLLRPDPRRPGGRAPRIGGVVALRRGPGDGISTSSDASDEAAAAKGGAAAPATRPPRRSAARMSVAGCGQKSR